MILIILIIITIILIINNNNVDGKSDSIVNNLPLIIPKYCIDSYSIEIFNKRKAAGLIPKTARIGNGIAIHGTRPEEEWTVDNEYSWTDGCISLKYTEMQDLFSYIPEGTKVKIQP